VTPIGCSSWTSSLAAASTWATGSLRKLGQSAAHGFPGQLCCLDGSVGRGTYLRSIHRALSEPNNREWLMRANTQLAGKLNIESKPDQGKPIPAESVQTRQVLSGAKEEPEPNLPSVSWLPVPVGLPQHDVEWSYPDGYVRIGYVSFMVDSPTEEIQVEETTPLQSTQSMRSRTIVQKDNWHYQQRVSMSLTFADVRTRRTGCCCRSSGSSRRRRSSRCSITFSSSTISRH
jgi:hypothetical protein